MKYLKIILLLLGGLAVLCGLIWIGQGTGVFPYPRASFMISQRPWAYRGIALAVAGGILAMVSRRL